MKNTIIAVFLSGTLFIIGCTPKVMVPPKIDLSHYEKIGLIEFKSNSEGNLTPFITERFLEAILEDQPGTMVIEMGTEEEILAELGYSSMGPDAVRAIGENYDIKTIITGILDLTEPSTDVDFFGSISNISVSSSVSAMLTVKMKDASTGSTIWSGSGRDERELSDAGFYGGIFHFDAEDPDDAYSKLADKLVREVTKDFRVTYERKKD